MLVRREVIDHVGMLDEDFFMYGEDVTGVIELRKRDGRSIIIRRLRSSTTKAPERNARVGR